MSMFLQFFGHAIEAIESQFRASAQAGRKRGQRVK
jgi:hypothetical protein